MCGYRGSIHGHTPSSTCCSTRATMKVSRPPPLCTVTSNCQLRHLHQHNSTKVKSSHCQQTLPLCMQPKKHTSRCSMGLPCCCCCLPCDSNCAGANSAERWLASPPPIMPTYQKLSSKLPNAWIPGTPSNSTPHCASSLEPQAATVHNVLLASWHHTGRHAQSLLLSQM
jgi:hypothetical protein